MTRIVVTGCAGMIGSHLVDELVKRPDTLVLGVDDLSFGTMDNLTGVLGLPNFRFYRADVLDLEALKILCCNADVIVHLAAVKKIGEKDPGLRTLRVNSRGTENVFEVARMWGCKVILASTSDVYGMAPVPHAEDDDLLLGPSMIKRWAYAVSKLYDEQLAFAYYKDEKVPIVVLRYFGGFSPRSSFSWSGGHVPIFIDAVLHDQPMKVHGDGTQTRSMAFVLDIVRGTLAAMDSPEAIGEIINLGNDEEISVIDTAKMVHQTVCDVTGLDRELKIEFVPFATIFGKYKDIMRRRPELSKARRILGYAPRFNLKDSILETVRVHSAALGLAGSL
jgi:UDP-glucose 4-epimerase